MEQVSVVIEANVAYITLERPESLNALNAELSQDLMQAFDGANSNPEVRAVVLAGRGTSFCAGADLKDPNTHDGSDVVAFLAPPPNSVHAVSMCRKPVVTAVQGWCVGGGIEMAVSSDIVVASEDARFFFPQVELGIVPGMTRLVRRVGQTWATRLVMLGERIDAIEAFRIGLVSEVVSADRLEARVAEIAADLASRPIAALLLAKESLSEAGDVPVQSGVRADRYRLFMLSETGEKKSAHAAFGTDAAAKPAQ